MEGDGSGARVAGGAPRTRADAHELRAQIFNLRPTFTFETKQAIYKYVLGLLRAEKVGSGAIILSPGADSCRHPHVDLRSLDVAQLKHIYDMIVSGG